MDFDSIISFLFLLAFFILPGILKKMKATKGKTATPKKANKKPSIFDKIGEKIQKFVQELEQQTRQQRQADKNQDSPWDALADDQTSSQNFEITDQKDDYFREPESQIAGTTTSEAAIPAYHAEQEDFEKVITKKEIIKEPLIEREPLREYSGQSNLIFKSNPLQNAVIWAEILGNPVGLKTRLK